MKKIIITLSVAVLFIAVFPMTALAHGHGGNAAVKSYALCSVEDCNTVGNHWHSRICYAGHTMNDGHDYHQLCDVKDCTKTESHYHNGVACLPHTIGDGHSYHQSQHCGGCRH